MNRHPNIIWILVDSVRSYPTDVDDRGKLPMMERFGEQSVEFLNVVTSAPSTIMAISAMMSSLPSYVIARNFDDFMFDHQYVTSLNDILKTHGYFTMAFFRHPYPREKFRNLLDAVPSKFWPSHLRHNEIWTNSDLRMVLDKVLKSEIPRPAFLFTHFTCRKDPKASDIVEDALQSFLKAGFSYDDTIYVLCSDHGYPDPSRGFTPEGLKRQSLTHDLILTDDNIKIPLYIKYPGCVSKKINTAVSSLDIMPTILDLAGISPEQVIPDSTEGYSLTPLLEGTTFERPGSLFVRSDARLMYQTGRITAIRNDNYKYLRHHDRPSGENEELYDLVNDPLEGNNIIETEVPALQSVLAEFRAEFVRQEQNAFRRQTSYMLSRFHKQAQVQVGHNPLNSAPERVLMLIEPLTAGYGKLALEVVREAWPVAELDLLLPEQTQVSDNCVAHKYNFAMDDTTKVCEFIGVPPTAGYDVQLVFSINPSNPTTKGLLQLSKKVRASKTLILDCNMNAYRRRQFWYYRFRAMLSRLQYIRKEPMAVWKLLTDSYRVLYKRLVKRI